MLVEPVDRQFLGRFAFFDVDPVVRDTFDGNQFFNFRGPAGGQV